MVEGGKTGKQTGESGGIVRQKDTGWVMRISSRHDLSIVANTSEDGIEIVFLERMADSKSESV